MVNAIGRCIGWFLKDLHRLWWAAILILPAILFLVAPETLAAVLSLLIAFPLVEFIFGFLGIFVGGRGQKTIISGNKYTAKPNAFPAFVTEIVAIAYASMWLEDTLSTYISSSSSLFGVYLIMLVLYGYYYFVGCRAN